MATAASGGRDQRGGALAVRDRPWECVALGPAVGGDQSGIRCLAGDRLGEMVESVQRDLAKRLRVPIDGHDVPVPKIVYEVGALEGLLTGADQVQLRPGYSPLSDAQRGPGDRLRRVTRGARGTLGLSATDGGLDV